MLAVADVSVTAGMLEKKKRGRKVGGGGGERGLKSVGEFLTG